MAVLPTSSPFTLFLEEQGAKLWSPEGALLAELPELPIGQELRRTWGDLLAPHLPAGAGVQLLLRHQTLAVSCQEVPFLSAKERQDVASRVVAAEAGEEILNWSSGLDADSFAEGGHQLWVAAHPAAEMWAWLGAIKLGKGTLAFATPWQRALLSALGTDPQASKDRLVLALEANAGHLLYFRGQGLILQRSFRLPEGVDPGNLDEASGELLVEAIAEELGRSLQFLKQKHRGATFEILNLIGLQRLPAGLEDRMARGPRLKLHILAPDLGAFLLKGTAGERSRRDGLNLVPEEVLQARKQRALRVGIWMTAAVILGLCGLATLTLLNQERAQRIEADRAEQARDLRRSLAEAQAQVMRVRFPLLRLRTAEQRQAEAAAGLSSLSEALFAAPEGLTLESLEIVQVPGEKVLHRFTVSGIVRTQRQFSVGPLATYMARLAARPGLSLSPQRKVEVLDRRLEGAKAPDERALTRFTLEGVAQ